MANKRTLTVNVPATRIVRQSTHSGVGCDWLLYVSGDCVARSTIAELVAIARDWYGRRSVAYWNVVEQCWERMTI